MNRTKTWLLTLGLVYVLSCTAMAQQPFTGYEQADIPAPVPEMGDSWFAQPQLSTYGRGPQPPNGVYFNVDYMRLAIQAPEAADIGPVSSLRVRRAFVEPEFDELIVWRIREDVHRPEDLNFGAHWRHHSTNAG